MTRLTPKPLRGFWLAMCCLVAASGLTGLFGFHREPVHEGKKLAIWLDEAFASGAYEASAGAGPAETALRAMGASAQPELVKLAGARNSVIKENLARFFHGSRPVGSYTRPADESHTLAVWGFRVLGAAAEPAVPDLVRLLESGDIAVRTTAASCLGEIGEPARKAVPALTKTLAGSHAGSDGGMERCQSAFALGQIGPAAGAAIPQLLAAAGDPAWNVRLGARVALIKIRGDSPLPLLRQLDDASDRDWCQTAMMISTLGDRAQAAIPALLAAARGTNDLVQVYALQALGKIRSRPELCLVPMVTALQSSNAMVRMAALTAIRSFGAAARQCAPALAPCLSDADPAIRWQCPNTLKIIAH